MPRVELLADQGIRSHLSEALAPFPLRSPAYLNTGPERRKEGPRKFGANIYACALAGPVGRLRRCETRTSPAAGAYFHQAGAALRRATLAHLFPFQGAAGKEAPTTRERNAIAAASRLCFIRGRAFPSASLRRRGVNARSLRNRGRGAGLRFKQDRNEGGA